MGGLSINEERIIQIAAKIAHLENTAVISDRDAGVNMKKELEERTKQLTKLKTGNSPIRTKFGKSDQEEFIIYLP